MKSRALFVIGLAVGSCISFAIARGSAQPHTSKFASLQRPAAVTELEWRLTEARLSRVESQVEGLPHLCCVRWSFDPSADKIRGRLMSGEDVWKSNFGEMKNLIEEAALFSISDAKHEIEDAGGVKTLDSDYEIEFLALEKDTAQFKVFATYASGKVQLSDTKLK